MAKEIKIAMELDKITANKIRFTELGDNEHIGTIYIPKRTLKALDNPDGSEEIEVVIRKKS